MQHGGRGLVEPAEKLYAALEAASRYRQVAAVSLHLAIHAVGNLGHA